MFNADTKTLARIAPQIQRVLIIDPSNAAAKLAADLMKGMGSRQIAFANSTIRALGLVDEMDPQIILVEYQGTALDGLDFTRRLRRSRAAARQAPVIMITAEATAASILGARNSGVHEFLRKPFTAGDLFRRVENVVLKPRDWIQVESYVGPDRRRFNSGDYAGDEKRTVAPGQDAAPAAAQRPVAI